MNAPAFPATAEAFYALRDHRTNIYGGIDASYTLKSVCVTAEPATLNTPAGRAMLAVSANLLSRWCRTVFFALPGEEMRDILAQMRDADHFGKFEQADDGCNADLRLHIGAGFEGVGGGATIISAFGWLAAVRRPGGGHLDAYAGSNTAGAAAAAILGGAQLFRDAVGAKQLYPPDFIYDVFTGAPVASATAQDRTPWQPPADLRLLMLGAGSVGTASAYFLSQLGVGVRQDVVDADIVKVENFGRSPVFGKSNYAACKPDALASALADTSVTTTPIGRWWDEAPNLDLTDYDLLLPLANERGVRWQVQASIPPLMIHASTGGSWNVNFGRHIPGVGDCLADRFSAFMDAERAAMACAEGKVEVAPAVTIDASLPFLSFWAGFLVAADIARLEIDGYPHNPNFAEYSFGGSRFKPLQYDKLPAVRCVCRGQGLGFWSRMAESRFARLSPPTW
jgi:hypothetical protein